MALVADYGDGGGSVWRRGPPRSMVRISENFLQSIETCDTEETWLDTLCLLLGFLFLVEQIHQIWNKKQHRPVVPEQLNKAVSQSVSFPCESVSSINASVAAVQHLLVR